MIPAYNLTDWQLPTDEQLPRVLVLSRSQFDMIDKEAQKKQK